MNRSNRKSIAPVWYGLIAVVAVAICIQLPLKNASPRLINSVDTVALFKIFNNQPTSLRVEEGGVAYLTPFSRNNRRSGVEGHVKIGVFPTNQAAKSIFSSNASSSRAYSETKVNGEKIGSEFKCWYGPVGDNGKGGNCLLRRDNCVINFSYRGTLEDMLTLARKVDNGLQSNAISQRGELKIPHLVASYPKQVRADSRFKVDFKLQGVAPILVNTTEFAVPIRENQFSLYERTPRSAGQFKKNFLMSTTGNLIFSETIQLKALAL